MPSSYADRTRICQSTSTGCSGKTRHRIPFCLALLLLFLVASSTQSVFAAFDIYIYKDPNGALSFTSVPTQSRYARVMRSEETRETKTRSSRVNLTNTVVQLFRDKDTDEVGYLDGETFIPLWPEGYTRFTDNNTAFASPNEYEDIWVSGLSDQVGLIKMRQGLPLGVTVTAIDWLIEQNLDKYKPRMTSHSSPLRAAFFIIAFIIGLASPLVMIVRHRDKNLATIPILIRSTVNNYVRSHGSRLLPLLMRSVKDNYHSLTTFFVLIRTAVRKYLLGNCCRYCSEHTNNNPRICNQCQTRFESEKTTAEALENEAREHRNGSINGSERELAPAENGFDPYQVLRITRNANQEEIKAAYLNLMKKYHPDRVSHLGQEFQELAEGKAQLINHAYQVLIAKGD